MNTPAIGVVTAGDPLSRGAMRHELAMRLLGEIFSGQIPAGKRLQVVDLTTRFGTSSTPVREALIELSGIGVVDFVHNRGVVVRPFGPEQLREIYQIRRLLETEATRMACGRIEQATLAELKVVFVDLSKPRRSQEWHLAERTADQNLHAIIAQQCGSKRLAEEIQRYDAMVQTTRDVIGYNRRNLLESVEQHLAIVEALISGDATAAADAMALHVDRVGQALEEAMLARK